ncbi:MAG TPA: ATP-binding protein [Tepidisphaeraceae bacterium]|jgi:signal transduction histidine kinase/ActR/RegA family two-component response regulator|nr:ATP-binding protein [Tepidisphaeraceae bacterium]
METTDERAGLSTERVLVLAPVGRDAAVVCQVLGDGGIACATVRDAPDLAQGLRGGAGAVLLTEEALGPAGEAALVDVLAAQRTWSDVPVLLLLAPGERAVSRASRAVQALRSAGNVTVFVRPVPALALVTAAQAAVRARKRQYEVRDLLAREHAARVEAEQANRLKDEFLATVSHELRTPLSAILLWSRLAAGGRLGEEKISDALQMIERSATAQSQLIDDLLDAARMISGKLRLDARPCQLEPAVRAAAEVVRPSAQAKGVRFDVRLDPDAGPVLADASRVQQIVWNLLSNAVKFTPRGGSVRADLSREGGEVVIRVVDSGHGIRPEFLPHVFERFRQGDASMTRHHGGLGLGLAISRQLIELHGATIEAHSEGQDKGATFIARFPLAHPGPAARVGGTASASSPNPAAPTPLAGVRVLLVEDESDGRQAMAWALEEAGAQVTAVGTAADALAALATTRSEGQPHVLVSDIGLPGLDGYQLIERVRSLHASRGGVVRGLAVSAYARDADRQRALAAGFQAHLAKPLDPEQLIAAVAALAAGPRE